MHLFLLLPFLFFLSKERNQHLTLISKDYEIFLIDVEHIQDFCHSVSHLIGLEVSVRVL
ncbi:hypothetical protein RchiOBHm_Chr7g0208731 [Rosa chinensis]|uniref:Uncharacterized protein n=1 Tax=Rosa chinensis TaxID=74649 RepID=A0A2P6P9S4_ROSCH|nr:hypothetical protein RchiOBHm_Chr7g0208731 [Rosa chinensis]